MSKPKIRPQSFYLYNNCWFKDVDHHFVSFLLYHKGETKWEGPQIPDDVLRKVLADLNHYVGAATSWEEIHYRREMLYKRYNTFKLVKDFPGAYFNREENVIKGLTGPAWATLFSVDAFARAYYHAADSEWDRLDLLFSGRNPIAARRRVVQALSPVSDQHSSTSHAVTRTGEDDTHTQSAGVRGQPHPSSTAGFGADEAPASSCGSCSAQWE